MNAHQPSRLRPFWLLALATAFALSTTTTVPAQTTKSTPATKVQEKAKEKAKSSDPLDVNSATPAELMELPGIGEVIAKKIVDGRPYKTLDDLSKAGVNAATLAKIKPLTTVRPLPTPVDVNTATVDRLETLPGVGPALAKAIVDARPYAKFDDLGRVKGLGTAKLEALRGRVSFGKATVEEKVKAKVEATKEEMKTKADSAKSKVAAAKEDLKTKAEAAKDDVKAKVDAAKPKVATAKEEMKNKAEAAKEKVKEKVESAKAKKLPPGTKININTATAEELDGLIGIGPVRAKLIIEGRPYEKIEDIMKVKGIKEVEFGKIKDQITVK